MRKTVGEKVKGAAQFFVTGKDTNTTPDNDNNTDNSNTNNNSNNPNNTINTNVTNSTNTATNYSTNHVIPKEKVKYVDIKTQRAYWFDSELIKIFDKEYPKKKYDKSQIMNDLLRKFLIENGKI